MDDKKTIVVFRYDDYTGTSPIEVEKKLFETFNRAGMGISVGVVPLVTSGDYHVRECDQYVELSDKKIQLLKKYADIRTVNVVLHGLNHINCSDDVVPTEFRHIDYDVQLNKIKKGKEILESISGCGVTSFIPPWNSYDVNTLLCLKENEITCLSANRYGPSIDDSDLKYLPITIEFKDLDSAIAAAQSSNAENQIISVLLHPYDFISSGDDRGSIDWSDLEEKLTLLKGFHAIKVLTIEGCLNSCNIDLGHARYKFNAPGHLENIYPPFIKNTYNNPVYKDKKSAFFTRTLNILKLTLFYLLIAVSLYMITDFIGLRFNYYYHYNYFYFFFVFSLSSLLAYTSLKKIIYFKKFFVAYSFIMILIAISL